MIAKLELKLHEGINNYKIGADINLYSDNATSISKDDEIGWKTYSMKDGVELNVEENRVVSISCSKSCYYNGLDLIGVSRKNFEGILNLDENVERKLEMIYLQSKGKEVEVIDYDDVGLQVWIDNNEIIAIMLLEE